MTKERQRKYKGIVIGLIFGLLMTGIMSFNVFADEAESPPPSAETIESTEDAMTGEGTPVSTDALTESLSEETYSDTEDSKMEDAQSAESASDPEAFTVQEADRSETQTETEAPADTAGAKSETAVSDTAGAGHRGTGRHERRLPGGKRKSK